MKISYIHGVCVRNDAISNSIRDEISWLCSEDHNDVRLYAYVCDYDDLPFTNVRDLRDVAFDQHFQSSDLVVFHFGVYYPLFNLLSLVSKRTKRLVVFHNITPKEFVLAESHELIDKSFAQMSNIIWADHVICVSETNLAVLHKAGIQVPTSVFPLAVHVGQEPPHSKPSFSDRCVRIAFVGRFVRSKGPHELLTAMQRLLEDSQNVRIRLDMVGNLVFSDQTLLNEIRTTAQLIEHKYPRCIQVQLHGSVTEETKLQILHAADLFVLPTYHEGFCVPIVEAMANGCKVIAYENSNTPAISGGLATLTPTGDVDQLSFALQQSVKQIGSDQWRVGGKGSYEEYVNLTKIHLQQFSPDLIAQRYTNFILQLMNGKYSTPAQRSIV